MNVRYDYTTNCYDNPEEKTIGKLTLSSHKIFESADGYEAMEGYEWHSVNTFTTRMCEAGVNVKVMQSVLGHADSAITLDVYAEAQPEFQREEMLNFEEYFGRRKVA